MSCHLDWTCFSGALIGCCTAVGLIWVGLDISPAMLDVAVDREVSLGSEVW